jgi:hypothetical protein
MLINNPGGSAAFTLSANTVFASTFTDLLSLPSTISYIQIGIVGMSTNGVSPLLLQLGKSGGVETTGYNGTCTTTSIVATGSATNTAGFQISTTPSAATLYSGIIGLMLVAPASNTWAVAGNVAYLDTNNYVSILSGNKALAGTLDRIRITTVGGTDTFDAGSFRISYY